MTEHDPRSASAWSATPSWAPRTPRPGAPRPAFFDLPLRARACGVCRPDAGRGRRGRRRGSAGSRRRDRLAGAARARRHRPDRHLHPGRHARRDRDRRAGGRQARAVREAAGQHRRRGRGDGRRGRAGRRPRRARDGRLHLPPHPGRGAGPAAGRGRAGSATIRHVRAQYLQDWLADEEAPLTWRLDKEKAGSGALGDIGAHIIDVAQFVTGRAHHRGLRPAGDLRQGAAARRRALGAACPATAPAPSAGRSPWTTPPLFLGRLRRRRARRRSRPPGSPSGRKNAMRLEVNGSRGQPRLRLRGHERPAASTTPASRPRRRVPPDPRHRARAPVHRGLVAPRPRAGLRARLHPPGGRPRHRRSPTAAQPAPSFADGLQVQRVLAAVEAQLGRPTGQPRWHRTAPTHEEETDDGTTDHPVHRPVGRPAVRGGGAARRRVGLRRPGDRLLGRPPRPVARRRGRRLHRRPAGRSWTSTA